MILRNTLVGLALLGFAFALFGAMVEPGLWITAAFSGLLVAILVFERHRYQQGRAVPPRDSLRPTDEIFIDPETDRPVRVWLDQAGKRFYLPEPQG